MVTAAPGVRVPLIFVSAFHWKLCVVPSARVTSTSLWEATTRATVPVTDGALSSGEYSAETAARAIHDRATADRILRMILPQTHSCGTLAAPGSFLGFDSGLQPP